MGFAPYGYYLVPFISLSFLIYTWTNSKPKQTFCYGYLFGLGMFGVGVNWLHISINLFGGMNLIAALFVTYLLVAFISIFPALTGYLAKRYFDNNRTVLLLIAIPALWVLTEWCRSWIFTGFPWLNLGNSQIDSPLSGIVPIAGVYGVTWAVVLSSAILVFILDTTSRNRIISVVALVLLWAGSGQLYFKNWTDVYQTNLSIAIIQGGIPQELKWKAEMRQKSFDLYADLTDPYWGHDLIIWPETAIPAFYHNAGGFINILKQKAQQHHSDLLVGLPVKDADSSKYYNSAMLLNKETETYYKRHLVPFGEYLPFATLLRPILHFINIPMSSFSKGEQERPLLIGNNVNIGISICYEDTFGEEVIEALPDAEVLVNISNDAWFGDSLAPHQHLQMARLRALESGRYMLRATNTGITAVIDEKGQIVKQSAQFKADTVSAQITLFKGITPYARFGNVPIILLAVLILTCLKYLRATFNFTSDFTP